MSAGQPVLPGNPIPLELNLEQAPTSTVYVRATVTDQLGVGVAGSPVSMGAITAKKFTSQLILMPDRDYVTASYEVFDDAAFTQPSEEFKDGEDRFYRSTIIGGGSGGGSGISSLRTLVGTIKTADISGNIDKIPELKGTIEND